VVVPTYNEAKNIETLVIRVFDSLKKGRVNGELLIIDDNSPDGTAALAAKMKQDHAIRVYVRELREGPGPAIMDGIRLAAVGGPCIAGELAGRRRSCVVFGSRDHDAVEKLAAVFRTPYYHVWTTTDLVGLEFCAALKNAYTLGVGMVLGLLDSAGGVDAAGADMHNLAAAVFAQACTEIGRILGVVGGSRELAYGLPGAGDLYVTCQGGRTVRMGKLLGLGRTYVEAQEIMAGETLEGAAIVHIMGKVLPRMVERGWLGPDELPLLRTLVDVLVHGQSLKFPLETFFGGKSRV
jgi:glycerol-3-phosphate dehydrogenase (NAD(P)+)